MFVCSVGDEVATNEEQLKAKNDRHALIAKYRKLQNGKFVRCTNCIIFMFFFLLTLCVRCWILEFDKLTAKKNADINALSKELEKVTQQKGL